MVGITLAFSVLSGGRPTAFLLLVCLMTFSGDLIALTFGVGGDRGQFDFYVNKTLWRSFDGYAGSGGEETVYLALDDGDHTLEVRTTTCLQPGHTFTSP